MGNTDCTQKTNKQTHTHTHTKRKNWGDHIFLKRSSYNMEIVNKYNYINKTIKHEGLRKEK